MKITCEREQLYTTSAERAALLCVDFQRDFLCDEGMAAQRGLPVRKLQRVLTPAARVLQAARRIGLAVIHLRECYEPDLSDLNPFRKARDTVVGTKGPLGRFLIKGESGTLIVEELAPRTGELVLDKAGFNAFYGTGLNELLSNKGITDVIIMGVTTQVCIASTLRGAVDCGYFPLVLQDCCAAFRDQDHEASISVIYSENHQFGWVSDSERFLRAASDAA